MSKTQLSVALGHDRAVREPQPVTLPRAIYDPELMSRQAREATVRLYCHD